LSRLEADRLIVIVPSRGRPDNIAALRDCWAETASPQARLVVALDEDDPELPRYLEQAGRDTIVGPRLRLGGTLNALAPVMAGRADVIGFCGDDHRPRTMGWVERIVDELDQMRTGIVYGNDLIQGENLPTAAFMTSDIINALGYMCPLGLTHMFLDNAWKAWGEGIRRLRYLPDVVIEHVHPLAGMVQSDSGYEEAAGHMGPDSIRWQQYISTGELAADVLKLQALL
jgi:hypothetical protein